MRHFFKDRYRYWYRLNIYCLEKIGANLISRYFRVMHMCQSASKIFTNLEYVPTRYVPTRHICQPASQIYTDSQNICQVYICAILIARCLHIRHICQPASQICTDLVYVLTWLGIYDSLLARYILTYHICQVYICAILIARCVPIRHICQPASQICTKLEYVPTWLLDMSTLGIFANLLAI